MCCPYFFNHRGVRSLVDKIDGKKGKEPNGTEDVRQDAELTLRGFLIPKTQVFQLFSTIKIAQPTSEDAQRKLVSLHHP